MTGSGPCSSVAQHDVLERWHDQLPHVALVERPSALSELPFQVEVLKPDIDQMAERTVGSQLTETAGEATSGSEFLLQAMFGSRPSVTARLDAA